MFLSKCNQISVSNKVDYGNVLLNPGSQEDLLDNAIMH